MDLFRVGFISITLIDLLDIIAVTFIFYKLYQLLRGSMAAQMMMGLVLILLISFIVQSLNLSGMTWLIKNVETVWVIAFVILFQPELRRILILIGKSRLMSKIFSVEGSRTIDEVVTSVLELSRRKYGGLIVMQRDVGLKSIAESGVKLRAEASAPLIVSIFNPQSPLHDGAIIIQNEVIEAAKCILPLSESTEVDPRMGTRHLAALGLSEESDAIIIVVSEETGKISVAQRGVFTRGVDEDTLRSMLNKAFLPGSGK
ncbi:MAG: diadenylate cyclase CdaA [Fidelibacterota bacterium]